MAKTDDEWRRWGEIDPYYGVLSDEKYRSESLSPNLEEFFATGEAFIASRLEKLERHFGPVRRGRALDFGCGVGRLVIPLAQRFDEALGLDISNAMLAEAKSNVDRANLTNVVLHASDDTLSKAEGQFDFVNTYIVLQHIPVSRGTRIIDELLRRVCAGGGISLHFTIDRQDGMIGTGAYWAQRHVIGAHNAINMVRGRRWNEPLMQMNAYSFSRTAQKLTDAGFGSLFVEPEAHGRFLTVNVLARRTEETRDER